VPGARVKRAEAFAALRPDGIVRRMRPEKPSDAPPDATSLHAAAVAYLARYSATRATLSRALNRVVDRWLRGASGPDAPAMAALAKRAVPEVVASLVSAGALDDAAFATRRARKLARTGHSSAATTAHLAARGVPPELIRTALAPGEEAELAAAIVYMRRRRLGPFRSGGAGPDAGLKALGAMARAGFDGATARRALSLSEQDAAEMLARNGGREP